MNKEQLKEYTECGNEIDFKYKNKMYSITYGTFNNERFISFCEFYKETTEVRTFEELVKVTRNNITVLQMWESLTENEIWIY